MFYYPITNSIILQVVRVATSEYGDQFRVTTSPLSKSDSDATRRSNFNLSKRSPTPLPPPVRQRREPSVHQGELHR